MKGWTNIFLLILVFLSFLTIAGCGGSGNGKVEFEGIESSGSCLPGTDECIESCATGTGAICKPGTGFERQCDCDHAWNKGTSKLLG